MKRILYFFCIHFIVYLPNLTGKIVETEHFNKILDYATNETLILLDIDDTLLIPAQTLGTDVWFRYRLEGYLSDGLNYAKALDKALAEWEAVRHLTQIELVENGTDKVIESLQKKHISVMGLTTQGLALTSRTITQLLSLHIDLSLTAPSKEDHYFINKHGVLYKDGVLFTAGTPKGTIA